MTELLGYDFDLRRLSLFDWLVVLFTSPVAPFALGYALSMAAKPTDEPSPENDET